MLFIDCRVQMSSVSKEAAASSQYPDRPAQSVLYHCPQNPLSCFKSVEVWGKNQVSFTKLDHKKQTWPEMALMGDFESYPRQIKGGKKKIGKLAETSLQKC